ncbi:hypothetical protein [Paraburkholderia bryophila]|uniref:Uncharacterized protein n=1 Tax=Paraburkholderia bryophila TaxID=420952 RepID=A0A7Y9WSD6_9BURK|nr:hypothetical protein [Paraburkholderia bryophila]NYH26264.1 hypothetical protein [Paraburkholderia bryophila]
MTLVEPRQVVMTEKTLLRKLKSIVCASAAVVRPTAQSLAGTIAIDPPRMAISIVSFCEKMSLRL